MKPIHRTLLASLSVAAFAAAPAQDPPTQTSAARSMQDAFARIASKLAPSVVSIAAYAADEPGDDHPVINDARWLVPITDDRYPGHHRINACSGFCIDDEAGILVTARSPLLKPDGTFAEVLDVETSDKLHSLAVVVGAEPTLDLAFLRIVVPVDGRDPRIKAVEWGDPASMKPGYWAFGIGDPFGIEQFMATGVLSAIPSRDCYQEKLSASYLQTAMSMHPEAFGGPLVDLDGRVIGLLAPRERSKTIGPPRGDLQFALPSTIIRGIAPSIIEKGSTRSPWIGFAVMSRGELRELLGPRGLSKLKRPPSGIYIENVFEPSSAHAAGLRPGDFLIRFNGHPVNTPIEFQKWFYLAGIGSSVELEIFREGEIITTRADIEVRPAEAITN